MIGNNHDLVKKNDCEIEEKCILKMVSQVNDPNLLHSIYLIFLQKSTINVNLKKRKKDLQCPWFNNELKFHFHT